MNDHPIRVLVIEDDPLQARLVRGMLAESGGDGFVCDTADRLSKGLERLADGGIDVVLLDLTLPDSWGAGAVARIAAAAPGIPIVVFSGAVEESLRREAARRGAREILMKDAVDAESLVRCLRKALGRVGP